MIDDPLGRFYGEDPAPQAGVKDPITGIRAPTDVAEKQKLREDEGKRKNEVAKRMITTLMRDDMGREWLYDILTACNIFGTPFTADPLLTAYNCGALDVGLRLDKAIKAFALDHYALMIEEGLERGKMWDDEAADTNKPTQRRTP